MKKIVKYLNGSWPLIILAPLLMVLEVLCDLMQPTLHCRRCWLHHALGQGEL